MARLDAKQIRNPSQVAGLPSGGSAQWQPTQAAGVAQSVVASLAPVATGAGVSQRLAPMSATVPEAAGVAVSSVVSGSSTAAEAAGVKISTVADLGTLARPSAGAKINQITINLAGTYPASSAATAAVSGSTSWTNAANATGSPNASSATIAGSLTAAVDSTLTLTMPTLPNKTALTITQVQLRFTAALTKGTLGSPTLTLRYSLNGGSSYTVLQAVTASNSGPFLFDITSAVAGNWTNLQNVRAQLEFATAAATGQNDSATCDAVELLISANTVQAP